MRPTLLLLAAALLIALAAPRADPAANPLGAITRHAPTHAEGRITQRLDAGSYTYLTLDAPDAPAWIVVMGRAPERGQHVRLTLWGQAAHLYSQRLQRDFAPLSFATQR